MTVHNRSHRGFRLRAAALIAGSVVVATTGCAFQGLNSLPLPGTVGGGKHATSYHIEFANIGALESNSPVMVDDVVVGHVGKMSFSNWHIDVEISVHADAVVPANALASIGQTSLLGSMHVALDPPIGQAPNGRLPADATIPLDKSMIFPSTEQTLSALSAVVNGGGLGRIGNIIHNFNAALSGRESDVRDLLNRLDRFVEVLDTQRANIVASIDEMKDLAVVFADQSQVISAALREIPQAFDVLITEQPRITHALKKLHAFSDSSTRLVHDTQTDLVTNLDNLGPTLRALADVGDGLDRALAYLTVYPYGQNLIDRAVRGDYMNLFEIIDLTVPRLKRTTMLGTRWEDPNAPLVPAPGEPAYLNFIADPLRSMTDAAAGTPTGPDQGPASQPAPSSAPAPAAGPPLIFAGPYGPPAGGG
ncbi:MCE family protein [[Mycobacterium] burgundiense]|uniref:MCE family protein n=1 Tax=[Mycobacterium] burgundiense TaxID=3064286 RepID=A0ABN9NRH3_9MYCO|nr:MCE family protein [Mycolicibacterium sp. MU0053]CAJ1510762.1 MCE family protein [Mycolicibacterium sp. MU0053]